MTKKPKLDQTYTTRKLKQCRKLVRDTEDPALRKVYRGYLKLWEERSGIKKVEKPEPEIEIEIEIPEPVKIIVPKIPDEIIAKAALVDKIIEAEIADRHPESIKVKVSEEILTELEEAAEQFLVEAEIPEELGIYEGVVDLIEDELVMDLPETPIDYAAMFEEEFPNKMAYRRKDGKLVETIAFKEYLNNITQ